MWTYTVSNLLSDCSNRGVCFIRDKCTDACINSKISCFFYVLFRRVLTMHDEMMKSDDE